MLKSKIHRATVTEANLDYVGSITIDKTILEAAGIHEHEKVSVVNINNGLRLETYAIAGEADSGIFCLNGAAARMAQKNDCIIIMAYCSILESKVNLHEPKVVIINKNNKIETIINHE